MEAVTTVQPMDEGVRYAATIIADVINRFPYEDILPTDRLVEDLHMDSLEMMDLILLLESRHGLLVSPQQLEKLLIFQDLIDLLCEGGVIAAS